MIIGKRDRRYVDQLERQNAHFRTGAITLQVVTKDFSPTMGLVPARDMLINVKKVLDVMLERTVNGT